MISAYKTTISTLFYDHVRHSEHRLYWLTPVAVFVFYLAVVSIMFWLQDYHDDSVMLATIHHTLHQQHLEWIVFALSALLILTLFLLWRYTLFKSSAEAALIAEAGFRRAMEDSMYTGMRVLEMDGRIAYVNPAFCRMVGWNAADLIGCTAPFPYWISKEYPTHYKLLESLLAGKTPRDGFEIDMQRRDGSCFVAHMYVSPLLNSNQKQIGWMTSITDITESKRVREALTAAHERFMTVLEGLDDAISVTTEHSFGLELLFANRTYRQLFGTQPNGHEELLLHTNGRYAFKSAAAFSSTAQRWFEVHHRTLTWTNAQIVLMQVARDITERRNHEEASRTQQEKLQLTSRLMTMGEMASSLAHELNQPLTAIVNYNMGAVAQIKSGQTKLNNLLPILEKTSVQAERAGKIIKRIREFVKRSEASYQRASIRKIIDNAISFADINARNSFIRIESFFPPNLPEIWADPILIEQVLLNLLKNGLESMEGHQIRELKIIVCSQGQYVEVAVVDRGCGLIESERLFEPFFSTKKQGMGMGLKICRTIIESHHGRLWAEANPEGGAIFRFTLRCALPMMPVQKHSVEELHA